MLVVLSKNISDVSKPGNMLRKKSCRKEDYRCLVDIRGAVVLLYLLVVTVLTNVNTRDCLLSFLCFVTVIWRYVTVHCNKLCQTTACSRRPCFPYTFPCYTVLYYIICVMVYGFVIRFNILCCNGRCYAMNDYAVQYISVL